MSSTFTFPPTTDVIKKLKKVSGVYLVFNTINGKVYVGSSNRVGIRLQAHAHNLRYGKHHSPHLQKAWEAYGKDAFVACLIETCEVSKLKEAEQAALDLWQSSNSKHGYNIRAISGWSPPIKITQLSKDRSDRMKRLWAENTCLGVLATKDAFKNPSPSAIKNRLTWVKSPENITRLNSFSKSREKCASWSHPTYGFFYGGVRSLERTFPDQKLQQACLIRLRNKKQVNPHKGWSLIS